MGEDADIRDEDIGQMLKRLRGDTSFRAVQRQTGISNAYLSQIEKGMRQPGPKVLQRLASFYGVNIQELFKKPDIWRARGKSQALTRTRRWRGLTNTS